MCGSHLCPLAQASLVIPKQASLFSAAGPVGRRLWWRRTAASQEPSGHLGVAASSSPLFPHYLPPRLGAELEGWQACSTPGQQTKGEEGNGVVDSQPGLQRCSFDVCSFGCWNYAALLPANFPRPLVLRLVCDIGSFLAEVDECAAGMFLLYKCQ